MMSLEDPAMAQPDQDPEGASSSLFGKDRCCFYCPCLGSRRSSAVGSAWWQRIRPSSSHHHQRWWTRAFLKLREWSEIVAGPRWKTFIRRFNRNRGGDRGGHGRGQFQYDPLSYALNFDEGPRQEEDYDEDHEYGGFRSFSTRYAAVSPLEMKTPKTKSLDSGGKAAVSLVA